MENNKPNNHKDSGLNIGRIFWGLLLVLLGSLLIIDNFGFVSINWFDLWRLWPLAIVAAGLSILSVRGIIWKIVSAVFAVLSLAAILFVALNNFPVFDKFDNSDINIDNNGIHIMLRGR